MRGGEELLAQYGYDANGRRVSKTLANGVSASYSYNRAGLMTRLENRQGETVVSAWDYEYDLSGKQRAKTDRDGLRTEYRYDMLGQLALERTVNADGQETGSIRYTYDGYGNRLSAESTGYAQYSESYAYDITDRMVSRSRTEADETVETVYSYDLNGNLIRSESEGKATARSYNAFGEQMSYAREGLKLWYRYRPDGLRHSKEKVGGGAPGVVTHLWDGQEIAAELSGSGTVSAVYSRGNGELICQQIGENRSYYLHNAHGDVTERLDENGTLLKRYRYDRRRWVTRASRSMLTRTPLATAANTSTGRRRKSICARVTTTAPQAGSTARTPNATARTGTATAAQTRSTAPILPAQAGCPRRGTAQRSGFRTIKTRWLKLQWARSWSQRQRWQLRQLAV